MAIAANGSKSAAEKSGRRLRIPLWLKFVTVIVGLAALLLLAGGAISLWWGYNEAQRSALSGQQQKAEALAGRIGGVMIELESQLAWTTQPAWKSADVELQRADFTRMLSQFPVITELFFIDGNGLERLKVSRFAPDSIASQANHATEPRFIETVKARTWFGPAYVRNGSELSATIGLAHADGGVSVAEIDLAFVAALVNAAKQADSYAFVVDRTGRLIAHPGRNAATGDTDMSGLPQVKAALAAGGTGTIANAVADGEAPALAAYTEVPGVGWTVLSQTPRAEALAPFRSLLWQSALLLAAGLLIATAVGIWLARRVAAPIKRLHLGAERLAEGDLTQRVSVRRRDEIGALADQFNTMANLLQQSHTGLEAKMDDRAVGFDIALQQQSMTAEMLKTISRTDYDLEWVLDTLIGSTVRLSEANVGAVWLREGDAFRLAAQLGHTGDWVEAARKAPFTQGSDMHAVAAAAAYSGQVINVDDVSRDLRFMGDYGERPANSDERAALSVPLKHGNRVEAVFSLSRADPIPFTERQVGLVQDFADEALIAIRNVRLQETIEARNLDLAEAHEQQTATGEILSVMSQSPSDIGPVLDAIVANAARLCNAKYCYVDLFDGALPGFKAQHGLPPEAIDLIGRTAAPAAGSLAEQAATRREAVLVADLQAVTEAMPEAMSDELSRLLGIRSVAIVPLLKDGTAIGMMTVADPRPDALPTRRLTLLKAFADQAVIALDNARLSYETRTRAAERDSSLQQLAECTAERDEWRQRHAADVEAWELRHAAEMDEARRLHEAAAEEARQKFDASERQHAAELDEARRLYEAAAEEARQKFEAAQTQHAAEMDEAGRLHDAAVEEARQQFEAAQTQHAAEMDEARGLHAAAVEEARQKFEAAQTQHAAEMGEARRLHDAAAEEARLKFEAAEQRHAAEMDEARRLHDAAVEQAREKYDAAEQQQAAEMGEARRLHEAAVEEARQQFEAAERQHAAEMDEARRLHEAAVEEARQRHEAETGETRRLHAEALDGAHTVHVAKLDEARHLHAAEIGEARRLHAWDRDEARRFRGATAHVLGLLGSVEGDPQRTFDAVVATATELCRAGSAELRIARDDTLHLVAANGAAGGDGRTAELAIAGARVVHFVDEAGGGAGAALAVPVMLDGKAAGALTLSRKAALAFSEHEIELAGMLAAEAAVAAATERLASSLEEHNESLGNALRELGEVHERQAAAADVLRSVNDAAFDLTHVLSAMVGHAAQRCGATTARLYLTDGNTLRFAVGAGVTAEQRAYEEANPERVDANSLVGRAAIDRAVVHAPDIAADRMTSDAARFGDAAAMLCVPLLRDGSAVGVIALTRARPGPFGEREIELVRTFADQAAIAIENARLADDVRARIADLGEALRQQGATADVLKAISRSTFDLGGVLTALTASAAALCNAGGSAMYMLKDGAYRLGAATGAMPEHLVGPHLPGRDNWIGRAALDAAVIHVADADSNAQHPEITGIRGLAAILCVPLLRDGAVIGVFALTRSEPGPFTERQIALIATFADEAVLAIENSRLTGRVQTHAEELSRLMGELHAAQARLTQTERLAALGQLTAGIGSEIEERLAAVNDVSLLSNKLVDDIRMVLEAAVIDGGTRAEVEELGDTLKAELDKVVWHGKRAESVVRNMLLNANDGPGEDHGGGSGEHRPVDINQVVDESLGLAYHGKRAERKDFNITLEKTLDPTAGVVDLHPREITRVLLNLFANGFYATEKRNAESNGFGYQPVLKASTKNLGNAVEIRIRDNGTGIPADVQARMFTPFFTTKPAGEGTGLGLSLSHDIIVKQHSGTIDVETVPGSFTEFRIVLPRSRASNGRQGRRSNE